MITFTAYGIPAPKGSTKAFYRPGMKHAVITHDNARTKPWQEAVVSAARDAVGDGVPMEGPVVVRLEFYLPKPKSAPKRVIYPVKKPDLDKLVRTVKDAMTRAGVYRDDSQVVVLHTGKAFAAGPFDGDGEKGIPRVVVQVELVAEQRSLTA